MGNRLGIGLVGLTLLAGGGYALYTSRERPWLRVLAVGGCCTDGLWLRSAGAALALLFALLVTRWLLVALGWGRLGRRAAAGVAMLGVALQAAENIVKMRVRLVPERRIRIAITFAPDADPVDVIARLDREAVSRVRGVVGHDDLPAMVKLHVRRG
jgi:hypothetical protein